MRALVLLLVALPAAAGAVDPGAPGRFAVGTTTVTLVDADRGRALVTEVWYPAENDGRNAAQRRGRYPLVLVAHGNCGSRTNYEYLTVPLAGHGFLVAAPDFPGFTRDDCVAPSGHVPDAENDLRFLAAALRTAPEVGVPVRGRATGLVGHSLGTLAVLHATLDDRRLSPAVVLAPVGGAFSAKDFAGIHHRPVLVMGGTADTTIPIASAIRLFGLLPRPAVLVDIANGTHSGFTDVDPRLTPAALARQQALVVRYATAFLSRWLRHDRRFARVLRPADAAIQGGVELMLR